MFARPRRIEVDDGTELEYRGKFDKSVEVKVIEPDAEEMGRLRRGETIFLWIACVGSLFLVVGLAAFVVWVVI